MNAKSINFKSLFFLLLTVSALAITLLVNGQPTNYQPKSLPSQDKNVKAKFDSVYIPNRYIVEFDLTPMSVNRQKGINAQQLSTMYKLRFADFERDLVAIGREYSSKSGITSERAKIMSTFCKSFFGASIDASKDIIPEISKLTYVKKVYPVLRIRTCIKESVPLINVPYLWQNFSAKGEGVKVGIVDTGIDYTHADLGAGIGPTYKVKGGYDFVNNDNDPMDDQFHGTHVAGIVAADGVEYKGVAPKASLYALKVLSASGGGSSDDVIRAIDYSLDPNNDNDFSDRLDVLNMSIGSSDSNPNDPLVIAINNAVDAGIVICIAAGNNGDYYTIGVPGVAEKAITVAASTKDGHIAEFSSRGPLRFTYTIKPDVSAPGKSIESTIPNQQYQTLDGTSMACPHVAGVCALLIQLHPSWTPSQIKSAIKTTDVSVEEVNSSVAADILTQGVGRVDARSANEATTFFEPSSISFGFDNDLSTSWTSTKIINVENSSASSQSYQLTFDNLPAGVTISAEPSTFNLSASQSRNVTFTLSVDNAIVPIKDGEGFSYSGFCRIASAGKSLKLPWAFTKAAVLTLVLDYPDQLVRMLNPNYSIRWPDAISSDGLTYSFLLPINNYHLIVWDMDRRLVIKEGIEVNSSINLPISNSDAPYRIRFNPRDKNGQPIISPNSPNSEHDVYYRLLVPNTHMPRFDGWGFNDWVGYGKVNDSLLVSNFSSLFKLIKVDRINRISTGVADTYCFQYPEIFNVQSNSEITINSTDLKTLPVLYHIANGLQSNPRLMFSTSFRTPLPQFDFIDPKLFIGNDFIDTLRYLTTSSKTLKYNIHLTANYNDTVRYSPSWVIDYKNNSNKLSYATRFEVSKPIFLNHAADTFVISNTPWQFSKTATKIKVGDTLKIYPSPEHILHLNINNRYNSHGTLIYAQSYDSELSRKALSFDTLSYKIFNNSGQEIHSGRVKDPKKEITLSAGIYSSRIERVNYFVSGVSGKITSNNRFDLSRSDDPIPPVLTSFSILNSNGLPAMEINASEDFFLKFSIDDMYLFDNEPRSKTFASGNTRVYYRMNGSSAQWTEMPVEFQVDERTALRLWSLDFQDLGSPLPRPSGYWDPFLYSNYPPYFGNIYSVNLSSVNFSGQKLYDIKVTCADDLGNTMEQIWEPCFRVKGGSTDIDDPTVDEMFTANQNVPNPFSQTTSITFYLPRPSDVILSVYNMVGQPIASYTYNNLLKGEHTITFEGSSLPDGLYIYKINADGNTITRKMIHHNR